MMPAATSRNWPSARLFTEAVQCPGLCFLDPQLRATVPAVDRLGMPLVTSGQFAYVYKLKSEISSSQSFAVRCFRSHLGDREQRYAAINRHLKLHQIPSLANFSYESEGMLVSGIRYPIQIMEWIDGPTLDVYLDEVIDRRDVIMRLAAEWVRLVKTLRDAEIAHGDLQHGNIIVERGALRLVDLDGMFVPEMAGWNASELGHQHFQHPARDETWFGSTLDNFSSIVIYLSLISLAERPGLWAKYHDENLLFTKSDFLNAEHSLLIQEIRDIGPEQLRLADVLVSAIERGVMDVPGLPEIVEVEPGLPGWTSGPSEIEIEGRTREVDWAVAYANYPASSRWKRSGHNQPSAPARMGANRTTIGFRAATATAPALALTPVPRTISGISKAAVLNAKELLVNRFLWWYWGVFIVLAFLGLEFLYALPVALLLSAAISIVYGFVKAYNDSVVGVLNQSRFPSTSISTPRSATTMPAVARTPASVVATFSPQQTPTGQPIVGNRMLGIFHNAGCAWENKITASNRIEFISQLEAESAGYRACKVCIP